MFEITIVMLHNIFVVMLVFQDYFMNTKVIWKVFIWNRNLCKIVNVTLKKKHYQFNAFLLKKINLLKKYSFLPRCLNSSVFKRKAHLKMKIRSHKWQKLKTEGSLLTYSFSLRKSLISTLGLYLLFVPVISALFLYPLTSYCFLFSSWSLIS